MIMSAHDIEMEQLQLILRHPATEIKIGENKAWIWFPLDVIIEPDDNENTDS